MATIKKMRIRVKTDAGEEKEGEISHEEGWTAALVGREAVELAAYAHSDRDLHWRVLGDGGVAVLDDITVDVPVCVFVNGQWVCTRKKPEAEAEFNR